jgi:hypothetical protein
MNFFTFQDDEDQSVEEDQDGREEEEDYSVRFRMCLPNTRKNSCMTGLS